MPSFVNLFTRAFFVVLFLISFRAHADNLTAPAYDAPWQITSYASEAGIDRQRIFDIGFSTNGTVWIAADDGLRRFDGFNWQWFGTNSGLPSAFIRAVKVDAAGNVWVGSDAGAGTFDTQLGKYDPHGSETRLANSNVREIDQDPDGTLWFSCDEWPEHTLKPGGLTSCQNGRWQTFHQPEGLPMNYVTGYFRDSTGRQFVFSPHGWVQRFDDHWAPPADKGYDAEYSVLEMAEAADGSLFAQGEHVLLQLKGKSWQKCENNLTRTLCSTREGDLVALEYDNLKSQAWFSLWNGRTFVKSSASVPCPINARFYHLREAPDGSIWCVGYGTILRWNFHAGPWTVYPNLPPPRDVDDAGRVWFADNNQILVANGRQLHELPKGHFVLLNRMGRALVWSPSHDQLFVMGANDPASRTPVQTDCDTVDMTSTDQRDGFWIVGRNKENIPVVAHLEGNQTTSRICPELFHHRLISANGDAEGRLWIIAQNTNNIDYALALVTSNSVTWPRFASGLPALTYATWVAGARHCWMFGYSGLYEQTPIYSGSWDRVSAFPDGGLDASISSGNEMVFVFSGGKTGHPGCALFANGQWRVTYGDFYNPRFDPGKTSIYFPTSDGVFIRRQPGTLDLFHLETPDKTRANVAVADAAGAIWLGTAEGTLRYQRSHAPHTTIITPLATETRRGIPLPVIFHGRRQFEPLADPNAFRYSWRVDQQSWSPFFPWPGQKLALPPLKPGLHLLQVRSLDPDGNYEREPAKLTFTVLPVPLQERPWFWPLVALLVGTILWLIWLQVAYVRQIAQANNALRAEIGIRLQTEKELQRSREELEHRVAERTVELTRLNESLNREINERQLAQDLQERLEAQLREVQKMEAIGTLAGGIAHDFNNILAVIIPYCHVIKDEMPDQPELREHLDEVLKAADRAKNLVQQILTFSRRQNQEKQVIDLQPVVKETLKLLRSALPSTIKINQNIISASPVYADPTQIHQVIMNLCVNAEHAMAGKQGRLEISLDEISIDEAFCDQHPDLHPGRYVHLTVSDNGCGMTTEIQQRIFEPFFTTKETGKGTGLGLAVVHGIVKNHNGAILVESYPGRGSSFQVLLPAAPTEGPETSAEIRAPLPLAHGERVLIIDDETTITKVLKRLLTRVGYKVAAYNDPDDALKDFILHPTDFDLVVSDLTMPGMSGLELAKKLEEIRPNLPIAIMTGYCGDSVTQSQIAGQPNIRKIVEKPLKPDEIMLMLTELLKARPD